MSLFFDCWGIRTREGFGVKKMCRWHIFSRKREAGTEIHRISVAERKDFACKICRIPFGVPRKKHLSSAKTGEFFCCTNVLYVIE